MNQLFSALFGGFFTLSSPHVYQQPQVLQPQYQRQVARKKKIAKAKRPVPKMLASLPRGPVVPIPRADPRYSDIVPDHIIYPKPDELREASAKEKVEDLPPGKKKVNYYEMPGAMLIGKYWVFPYILKDVG